MARCAVLGSAYARRHVIQLGSEVRSSFRGRIDEIVIVTWGNQ